ncbi:Melibiose operon regulatory protein [compost metagenome]
MSNRHAQKEEVFTDILTYIANHLHDPMLTIDDIAQHVSLSVNYVRLIFKEHYQVSVSDYILESRIEKVKELLLETNWSIVEIAAQSGFQSKSHFFTAFKKATGLTPSQYREKRNQS